MPKSTKAITGPSLTVTFFVCLAFRQDKDVPWMGIRVEKALVKELVEVGSDGAFRYFKTAHSRRLDSSIVIYLDPVDPL